MDSREFEISNTLPTTSGSNVWLPELHNRLDSLWTTYLHHLDQYTTAQKLLQRRMSAGFLSLARANFTARDGVRRYGKDFYHDRAVASSRVRVLSPGDHSQPRVELVKWTADTTEDTSDAFEGKTGPENVEPKQQPSPPATPQHDADTGDLDGAAKEAKDEDQQPAESEATEGESKKAESTSTKDGTKKSTLPMDPIRWFGILVPSDLRSAQKSFFAAVEEPIEVSVNAAKAMREVEGDIRRLRKEIKKAEKSSI